MEIKQNQEHNGIELYFTAKPGAAVIGRLKANRFKWHSVKKCWYARATAANLELAARLQGAAVDSSSAAESGAVAQNTAPTVNRFGVRVGDLFVADWGYDQTNLTWLQVIALVGASSVRVVEVVPRIVRERQEGAMSRYIVAGVPGPGEMLPRVSHSIFIDDNEGGALKRLSDRFGRVQFKIGEGSGHSCDKYAGGELYESWYA